MALSFTTNNAGNVKPQKELRLLRKVKDNGSEDLVFIYIGKEEDQRYWESLPCKDGTMMMDKRESSKMISFPFCSWSLCQGQ